MRKKVGMCIVDGAWNLYSTKRPVIVCYQNFMDQKFVKLQKSNMTETANSEICAPNMPHCDSNELL